MKKVGPILILAAVAILFFTNPEKADFEKYISEEIEMVTAEEAGIKKFLGKVLSDPAAMILIEATEVDNMYLFSTYTIKLDQKEYKYIGIFDRFVAMHSEKITDLID